MVCKGGDMYAFWNGESWDQKIDNLIVTVDKATYARVQELQAAHPGKIVTGSYLNSHDSGMMMKLDKFTSLLPGSNVVFNKRIIFANEKMKLEDYATNQLNYTPEVGSTESFDELMNKLYEEEELNKILWFIGALLTNNMHLIQKFLFLYGGKGTGKGTAIKIIKMLFSGYWEPIDLAHLTGNSEFATGQVKEVPLLIDDDSDLSRIQKDTNLLKLTAHEPIPVNAKYKTTYDVIFNGLLITASNQRFKVRNIDSGITRRAVVASPTHETHDGATYQRLMGRLKYEIPHIAAKAMLLFEERGPYYYDNYVDMEMVEATDHIFAFVRDHAMLLEKDITLKQVSELYRVYLEDIGFDTNGYKRVIKSEMMRYYREFHAQKWVDGQSMKNLYVGFKKELVFPEVNVMASPVLEVSEYGLKTQPSIFDRIAADYPAQYATQQGTPKTPWDSTTTTLKDINTKELHYVRLPLNHIVIDFDMKGVDGEKDLSKNLLESTKFPPTYTEISKSGKGVHLHYIYEGDAANLEAIYEDDIEIKVFTGKQSLRRRLTQCNDLEMAHISSGLPEKERNGITMYPEVKMITWNEKKMRTAVKGNLEKKYHANTKPSVDYIKAIFEQAESVGAKYDLRDMRNAILTLAASSTNQAKYCIGVVNKINYCTIDDVVDIPMLQSNTTIVPDEDITFYDIEVYPNLFVVAWKRKGAQHKTIWYNPTPDQIEELVKKPLVGFNNRRYDNHILYARLLGEDNLSLYRQSQRIINDKDSQSGMYSGAYELSYADIYEYASKKQSLKKWEIELGIKHDEMELPWDQPVPEHLWPRVGEYCGNDVDATESVFDATEEDFTARLILTKLSGLSVNATTTQHAAKFLFGDDRRPQDKFIYADLSETFPGYSYSYGKSEYRGEDPGEGGYVHSEPGVYTDVALLDATSMHPKSLIAMNYFGPYTPRYKDLVDARVAIKHGDYDTARGAFDGALAPFLEDEEKAEALAYALKIIINIVYGMTSAKFDNKFKHTKNVDNIVAKRGALFMINLKHEVQSRGFTVAHIKTDSIKIPNATKEIIDFVFDYGKQYGYDFEHEATYSKMALVNKAVYIANYGWAEKAYKVGTWDATGSQFAEPYVFKRLFSREEVVEDDYAITNQVRSAIYMEDKFIGKIARVYASVSGREMFSVAPHPKAGQPIMKMDKASGTVKDTGEVYPDIKKGHVSGTKGRLWKLMSEYTTKDDIDMSYYDGLVKDAVDAISNVGDINAIIDPLPDADPRIAAESITLPF